MFQFSIDINHSTQGYNASFYISKAIGKNKRSKLSQAVDLQISIV